MNPPHPLLPKLPLPKEERKLRQLVNALIDERENIARKLAVTQKEHDAIACLLDEVLDEWQKASLRELRLNEPQVGGT